MLSLFASTLTIIVLDVFYLWRERKHSESEGGIVTTHTLSLIQIQCKHERVGAWHDLGMEQCSMAWSGHGEV